VCRRNGLRRKVTVLVNPGNIAQTEATLLEGAGCRPPDGDGARHRGAGNAPRDRRRTNSGSKGTAKVGPVWPHNQTASIAAMHTPLQVRSRTADHPSPLVAWMSAANAVISVAVTPFRDARPRG
jgi:hypothetical protein